jgi:hypothetical protein
LKTNQNGGQDRGITKISENKSNGAYCTYCCQPGHIKSNCFKLKNKSNRDSGTSNNDGQGHRIFNSKNVLLRSITMKNNFFK